MADTPVTSAPTTPLVNIPAHYDSVYYNKPNCKSVMVHSNPSSFLHSGFQAILCFHAQTVFPVHLGLPKLDSYQDKVFLQVSPEDQPFVLQSQVASGLGMLINTTEYLILLQFIQKEWTRLSSKLNQQLKTMKEGSQPIFITGRLSFYNQGLAVFKTNVSSRLVFKAWIESSDPKGAIHCCLEKKVELMDAVEFLMLPMESLATLAHDTTGLQAMISNWAYYKSLAKK